MGATRGEAKDLGFRVKGLGQKRSNPAAPSVDFWAAAAGKARVDILLVPPLNLRNPAHACVARAQEIRNVAALCQGCLRQSADLLAARAVALRSQLDEALSTFDAVMGEASSMADSVVAEVRIAGKCVSLGGGRCAASWTRRCRRLMRSCGRRRAWWSAWWLRCGSRANVFRWGKGAAQPAGRGAVDV
eukprot:136846-Chlamydomonas_euryale.AAC.1